MDRLLGTRLTAVVTVAACSVLWHVVSMPLAGAQEISTPKRVPGIMTHRVLILPDSGGEHHVVQNSRGHYFVFTRKAAHFFEFDSAGKLVTAFGRHGKGPGEYEYPNLIFGTNDTLHIFDFVDYRHTVLTPEMHKVARTMTWKENHFSSLQVGHGLWATVSYARGLTDPIRVPTAIVLLNDSGMVAHRFGAPTTDRFDREDASRATTVCVGHRPGTFWATFRYRYHMELWDTTGTRLQTLTRVDEPWPIFKANGSLREEMAGCFVDRSGLLWTLIWTPRPNGPTFTPRVEGSNAPPTPPRDAFYETIVEVIDPARGVLVASQRFRQFFEPYFLPNGRVVATSEDESGDVTINIIELRLLK